jgi:diguanylate cyclase (GGDEF)-like protein
LAAALQRANAELTHLTLHDTLTKLPNRILIEDRIGRAIEECRRAGERCAVLFVDLDRFKLVNDTLGHLAGDEVLRTAAERLRSSVRLEDSVARVGGDEFVILLRRVAHDQDAALVARKIIGALGAPAQVFGRELRVTPSVGVSVFPMHGDNAEALITNADAAMYHIKKSVRNDFAFFAPQMSAVPPGRLALENDLRKALEGAQFELHYQPKVAVQSARITGMEALVRWRHPERGMIAPAEFIPLAEDTGLILPLGQWVMREACRQNRAWQDQGLPSMPVAINLSAVQLRRTDLVGAVAAVLHESALEPRFLELEITESVVMQNAAEAIGMLAELSRMGVHVAIDDFGTGYSSLSYLKRFPLRGLKIDRSFVRDISSDPDDAAIVQAIIALAHGLRLKVIAEGVETPEQLQFLRSLGSDEYQGYYRSKPLPADAFARLLAQEAHASEPDAQPSINRA